MEKGNEEFVAKKVKELTNNRDTISRERIVSQLLVSTQKSIANLTELSDSISHNSFVSLSHLLQLYIRMESMLDEIHELRRKYVL